MRLLAMYMDSSTDVLLCIDVLLLSRRTGGQTGGQKNKKIILFFMYNLGLFKFVHLITKSQYDSLCLKKSRGKKG